MRKACVWSVAALMALAACSGGGDGDDGGGTGPAVFTTLDVQPAAVGVTVTGTQQLTATARDQNNATMGGLTTTYQTSDATRATVSPTGLVTGVAIGTATITATGTVGTTIKTKTVTVTVANPTGNASVAATTASTFDPSSVSITVGGTVTWSFSTLEHNVTWDAGAPTGGNIGNTTSAQVSRTFPTAGTFNYRCTLHAGMTGTVRVQ